jgi:transposase
MKYVGIDLHKKVIVFCIVGQDRSILQQGRFLCQDVDRIRQFFGNLGEFQVVLEATANYEWLVDILLPMAKRVVLAHPRKLRIIAESVNKSDKVDARILAEFLALDLIPRAYRPTRRQREHRVLVRWRVNVSRRCARLKCRIRQVLANYNADRSKLFTAEGLVYLRQVAVSEADRFVLRQLLMELGQAQKQLLAARTRLRAFAKKGSASEQRDRQVLLTIPGVGEVTCEVVLAELAGAERFRSEKQAVAFAGLAPGRRESAGKAVDLGISKQGSRLLRWILVEAAWSTVRYSKLWQNRYEKLKSRRGAKKAIVAMARRLLCVMVAVLRSGQAYREVEPPATASSPEQPIPETTTKKAKTKTAKTKAAKTKAAESKTAEKRQRSPSV